MANVLWAVAETQTTALTTELNSLADGAMAAVSPTVDNSLGLFPVITVELALASLTPTGTPYVGIYVFYSHDGTTFEDRSASQPHALAYSLPVTTGAGAKKVVSRSLLILPFKFVLGVANHTNVAFAASGNTLQYRRLYQTVA